MSNPDISKEFVERIVKEPVERFRVRPGSNLGDGYTCAMVSVDIWRKSSPEKPETVLIKCFPDNPGRQAILDVGNIFYLELGVYNTIRPALVQFQKDLGVKDVIEPPIPTFFYGNYVDPEERKKMDKPMNPVENCIVMPDLREESNGAFRLRDRFLGLDYDHYILAMRAHGTFHALSWAYKCKKGIKKFEDAFPFMKPDLEKAASLLPVFQGFMHNGMNTARQYVTESPAAVEAVEYLKTVCDPAMELYMTMSDAVRTNPEIKKDDILRKPGPVVANEEPWEVLLHGDCWSNNMLFRYDQKTNRPVECLLVDLQLTRQGDPFADLNYTLYASGTPELRKKHLTSLLHVYYDTFEGVCSKLDVPLLPGWSWEEVNRRFHRAKMFGACMASAGLPTMLKAVGEIKNLDSQADELAKGSNKTDLEAAGDFFANLSVSSSANPILTRRLTAVLEELREDGVL